MGYRTRDTFSRNSCHKRNRIEVRKIIAVSAASLIVVVGGYAVYSHLPFVKVNKAIAAGNRYSQNEEYDAAINSYSEALELDAGAVSAYSNMASAYLSIDDSESAKKILYDGWQNTESEELLSNYLTVIMNEAVNTMNKGEGSIDTVLSVLPVIEADNTCSEAFEILDAAYDRCFAVYSSDADALFRGNDANSNYAKYEEILNRMVSVYEINPSDELKTLIMKYAVPNSSSFTMNYQDAVSYDQVLNKVATAIGTNEEISSLLACTGNMQQVQSIFTDIFDQLDVGNVDELRDFVVSDEYLALRDIFLNKEETPQENTTYVTISREAVIFNKGENGFSYRFLDFEENPETKGVITVWANFFEDDGVQRNAISYEPGAIDGNPYPHTKYTVTYLLSYTTKGSQTKVAKMNYRLSTAITDEEGNTTETVVGDWGGPDEWTMDIDTIESRIRA